MKKNTIKTLVIIYIILLCCVFFSTALSKNVSKLEGEVSINTAGIILNITTEISSIKNLDNTQQEISFVVNNYDGTTDSPIYNEIEYEYQISITTDENVPLEYELYKVENEVKTAITLTNGTSESVTMPYSEIKEDTYILKVKLDNKKYKDIEDILNISVYAVQ